MADSIRDALTKAIDSADTPEPVLDVQPTNDAAASPTSTTTTDQSTVQSSGADSSADASKAAPAGSSDGKTAAAATKVVEGGVNAGSQKPTTPGGGTSTPQPPPSPADQAPGSWKAAEKAEWEKIPAPARAAIKRREAEATRALNASTDARRHSDDFQRVLHPFEPLLQGRGVTDPLNQVIKPILQIRAALEIGSPQQKAQLVANMVRDFQIDVAQLDEALTNNIRNPAAVQAAPAAAPSYRSAPELQPLFALAERLAQRSQAVAQEAVASVEDLPHFEELREDMADVMERNAAQGRELTIQQAYDRAAVMNGLQPSNPPPAAAVTPSEAAAILARSRKAASSVAGAPSVSPGKKSSTLREQIENAVSQHSS